MPRQQPVAADASEEQKKPWLKLLLLLLCFFAFGFVGGLGFGVEATGLGVGFRVEGCPYTADSGITTRGFICSLSG